MFPIAFPDEEGHGPHDITAFHLTYQNWGPARADRPAILFQLDPPKQNHRIARPGLMRFQGMVVLNHQNNPIIDWQIPLTLSSKTSGAKMEAWKRTYGLTQEDSKSMSSIMR